MLTINIRWSSIIKPAKRISIVFLIVSLSTTLRDSALATAMADTGWTVQTSGTTQPLYSVKAVSGDVAWASGLGGTVVRTTNGGTNWIAVPLPVTDPATTMTALNANIAFVATLQGALKFSRARLWKTTNGGISWAVKDSILTGTSAVPMINGVHMFDASNGYYYGDPIAATWTLKRTTNGGETWANAATLIRDPLNETGYTNGMMWYGNLYGWFGSTEGKVIRTTDGGNSWIAVSAPGNTSSIWFNRLNLGMTTCTRSTDAGLTWSTITCPASDSYAYVGLLESEEFWAVAGPTSSTIYYSSNAGDSWTSTPPHGYSGSAGVFHISITRVGANVYGWAVGSAGRIVRYRRSGPTAVTEQEHIPNRFSLYQNYPNPFNPSTVIKFSVGTFGYTSLRVFDMLGREIAMLVNERLTPGEYERTWNAQGFTSGLYFYRLSAGEFVQTRKLVLLK